MYDYGSELAYTVMAFMLIYPTLWIIVYFQEERPVKEVIRYIEVEKLVIAEPVKEDPVRFTYVAPVKYTEVKQKPPVQKKKVGESTFVPAKPNPLIGDAIQCLTVLGVKKTDATKKVKEMFANHHYVSVEDFLVHYYQKQ